jgi:tetratricopeptide (TPR) repeat protein
MPRARASATKRSAPRPDPAPERPPGSPAPRIALNAALLAGFLGLTFLLGIFPLADTDFWWHLRTGDLIRQTGRIPHVDPYLFGGAPVKPWIDLHWGFQVLVSLGHALGGVDLLTLAKCAITTAAVAILLAARRRGWPLWVMVLAWVPALLLLAGRMYVRPETLTLLYLAAFLTILERWWDRPRFAFALPLIQVLWVNTQGLFVFGPIVLGFALLDAATRPAAFSPERRRWWRIALGCSAATGLACLLNPYGLAGALFPLQLLRTMGTKEFETIGELMPVPTFIRQAGWHNLSIQLHLATTVLGGLSFLIPLLWRWIARRTVHAAAPLEAAAPRRRRSARSRVAASHPSTGTPHSWRLSPFRLLLYTAFSLLSWKATRNSHQFAAVVGAVTAWNFGEWAAALSRRAAERPERVPSPRRLRATRLAALGGVLGLIVFVATGAFYRVVGEGRTVGLGERPLWFPHAACVATGAPGMPERFVCIHNGHAALWEYHNGPARKVYTDARLEVIGPNLFKEYGALQRSIATNQGWQPWFAERGNPGLLIDLVQAGEFATMAANVLADPSWRCVWFDAIASAFVHESYPDAGGPVDFDARHFDPDPATDPRDLAGLLATAKALLAVAGPLHAIPEMPRSGEIARRRAIAERLTRLAQGYAQRALRIEPQSDEAWKYLGQAQALRAERVAVPMMGRFAEPYDPLVDLPTLRATYALRRAVALRGDDIASLFGLVGLYQGRGMSEAALPYVERLSGLRGRSETQSALIEGARGALPRLRQQVAAMPSDEWKNLSELDALVRARIDKGQAQSAAELLERAYPPRARSWELTDRIATLYLHLGLPERARAVWNAATAVPRPGLRAARVALTYWIEGQDEPAREAFAAALANEPGLFEAHYVLAVMETDLGRREAALASARAALEVAPGEVARAVLRALVGLLESAGDVSRLTPEGP